MTLGSIIRSARESAGLSIDDLASVTSIRPTLLRQMESNNFENCGGDTYAKGHLRNIARKIGVAPQDLIDFFDEEHSTQSRTIHDLLVENYVTRQQIEKKGISRKGLIITSLSLLTIAAAAQVIITNTNSAPPTPKAKVSNSPSATPLPSPSSKATPLPSPSSTAAPSASGLTLIISAARSRAYIDVVIDGQHIYQGPLLQGESKTFQGPTSISVYLSDAGGVDLTLNGKMVAPLGGFNEEVRHTFRRNS